MLLQLELLLAELELLNGLLVLVLRRLPSQNDSSADKIAPIQYLLAMLDLEYSRDLRGQLRILLALRERNEPRMRHQLHGRVHQSRESILTRLCFESCSPRAGLLLRGSQHHGVGY